MIGSQGLAGEVMRNYVEHVQSQCENDHNAVSEPSSVLRSDGALSSPGCQITMTSPIHTKVHTFLIRLNPQQIATNLHVS